MPPTTQDFLIIGGFYLLQAINRLDDKIDAVRRDQEDMGVVLRAGMADVPQEIGSVRQEMLGSMRRSIRSSPPCNSGSRAV